MRRSARITLAGVAAVGLASCGRPRMDPCDAATFNEHACQDAINNGGYYWNGSWQNMSYRQPYPYYYDQFQTHISQGGASVGVPDSVYSHPVGDSHSVGGVERGGFGAHGAHGGGE